MSKEKTIGGRKMKCRDGCDNSVKIICHDKDITKLKCDKCGGVYVYGTEEEEDEKNE